MRQASAGTLASGHQNSITAPRWTDQIPDRIAWCVWLLEHNPAVFQEFRRLAGQFRQRNPDGRFSAELVLNVIRWQTTTRTTGDVFSIGNNAKSLFARLYLAEHPTALLEKRNSWLDHLSPSEWQTILDAWQAGYAWLAGNGPVSP
jgi:hypothetical protein